MNDEIFLLIMGLIIGLTLFGGLVLLAGPDVPEVKELGQSICRQEFNMDFDSCDNKELKCKPKEVKAEVKYDGIVVQIR